MKLRSQGTAAGALLALSLLAPTAFAQDGESVPRDLPLQDSLYRVWQGRELPLDELRQRVPHGASTLTDARELHVVIEGPAGAPAVPDELVESFGGRADTRWRNLLDAWVPLDRVVELARALPAGHRVRRALMAELQDQGPGLIGSDTYRDGGANGAGLAIGVIDSGFVGLTAASQAGAAPAGWNQLDYTGQGMQTTTPHGTGCVETAFDHVPGAEFWMFKIDSDADLGSAVDAAIQNGVDVISHSLGWFNTGWWDGQGAACAAALEAAQNGVIFVTSSGNYARQHWQGTFDTAPGSSFHDWSGTGDIDLAITVPGNAQLRLYMDWNANAGGIEDYNLYLFDTFGNQIASSANPFEFPEDIAWTNPFATPAIVNVRVTRFSGNTTDFEVFGTIGSQSLSFEYFTSSSSTISPVNTDHYNVISVGAVTQSEFSAGNGESGLVTSYSSQGPTNSGMLAPTLVAPTDTNTVTYGAFGGTSCAAPNAAGAILALQDSVPLYDDHPMQWLTRKHALLLKDWGAFGGDNVYGAGGINLAPYAPATVWLAEEYGNVGDLQSLPSFTLGGALGWVPPIGRILALGGGSYDEAVVLDVPHVLDAHGGVAVFGE